MQLDLLAPAKLCGRTRHGVGIYTRQLVTMIFSREWVWIGNGQSGSLQVSGVEDGVPFVVALLTSVLWRLTWVRHSPLVLVSEMDGIREMNVLPESIPLICEFKAKP